MHLLPKILARIIAETPDQDIGRFEHTPFLLVRIDEPDGRLATGLKNSSDPSDLTFVEPSVTRTRVEKASVLAAADELGDRLRAAPHFVLLLTKRHVGEPRIRVGRDPKSDVVLDHPTVSTTHAWLDSGEGSIQVLWDNASKNGTRVNGERVVGDKPVKTHPGDLIMFGDVLVTHCTFTMLRHILQADARTAR